MIKYFFKNKLSTLTHLSPSLARPLLYRPKNLFSQQATVLMDKASLQIRNSQVFELKFAKINQKNNSYQPISLQISSTLKLNDLKKSFQQQFNQQDVKFLSQQGQIISFTTPIQAFLNRYFILISKGYKIKVFGQFFQIQKNQQKQIKTKQLQQNLRQLQLPIFTQRQIQSYFSRVDTWLDAKYGLINVNSKDKISSKQLQDILVQSIQDPECSWEKFKQLQNQWRLIYQQVQILKNKYEQVLNLSQKISKRRMCLDLFLIMGNIGFITVGTYQVLSWDIVEPWAYFISSAAGIYLFTHASKFNKPFSLSNYKQYLINEKYLQTACKQLSFNMNEFDQKKRQLVILQSSMKDFIIAKL